LPARAAEPFGTALGEFDLIRRFFTRDQQVARVGIGDDCAIFGAQVGYEHCISTDMLVEGRHFLSDMDPAALGYKALATNLSDLAAMGAQPHSFLLSIGLPKADERWLQAFSAGLFQLAQRHNCPLIGGDTTRSPLVVISITVQGLVPHGAGVLRSGARVGDDIWVSGTLGDAALGLALLQERIRVSDPDQRERAIGRLHWPEPRVALGMELAGIASSMMDLSDGLAGDLLHILRASGRKAAVELAHLPMSTGLRDLPRMQALSLAAAGGDDYELLFTAEPRASARIEQLAEDHELPLSRIGCVLPLAGAEPPQIEWLLDGRPTQFEAQGFDHFDD
jgi:thiamine-monophosphate kinase